MGWDSLRFDLSDCVEDEDLNRKDLRVQKWAESLERHEETNTCFGVGISKRVTT